MFIKYVAGGLPINNTNVNVVILTLMPYSKLKHVGFYATLFVKYHTLVIDTLYICCKRKK